MRTTLIATLGLVAVVLGCSPRGDDPYKDPDFLLPYDRAVRDTWEQFGLS